MKVVVYEFSIGDVDDPEIYAAEPIWKWQQTEAGQWVMQNSLTDPVWCKSDNFQSWYYRYKIVADLSEKDATYFCLRWG